LGNQFNFSGLGVGYEQGASKNGNGKRKQKTGISNEGQILPERSIFWKFSRSRNGKKRLIFQYCRASAGGIRWQAAIDRREEILAGQYSCYYTLGMV